MRMLQPLLRLAALFLGVLVLAAAGMFGFVQTTPGRALVAHLVGRLASSDGIEVRIEGLSGFIPSDLQVARITLSDTQGAFAHIEGLRLAWSPLDLINRRVWVDNLTAERVEIERRPVLVAGQGGGAGGAWRVEMAYIETPRLDVGAPVLGEAAQLAFKGAVSVPGPAQGLFVTFRLDRRDGEGFAAGAVRFAPQTAELDVDIKAQEPEGGLFARLAGFEGLPAFDAQVKGTGTLDDWTGTLSARAGTLASLEGTATIMAQGADRVVQMTAHGDVGHALPAAYAPLFEGRSDLSARIVAAGEGGFRVDGLEFRAAGLTFSAQGAVPLAGPLGLGFTARVGESARFSALLPGISWSAATMTGGLTGTLSEPQLRAALKAAKLVVPGYSIGDLKLEVGAIGDATGTFALSADALGEGLSAADPHVAQALRGTGAVTLRGAWPSDGAPVLTEATVRLAGVDMRFAGRADLANVDGRLTVSRLDLAALSPLAGRPLSGSVSLSGDVKRTGAGGLLSLALSGTAHDVATTEPRLDGLIGGNSSFKGAVSVGADGAVAVDALSVEAPGASLAVNGRIDASHADLTASVSLPDLERLDPRLGGGATANAAFSGRLAALGVTGQISVPRGTALGQNVEDLILAFTLEDLTGQVAGTARLDGRIGGKPSRGSVALASGADGSHALTGLDIAIGSARAQGDLTLAPSGLATGTLELVAQDLSDISPLLLTPVSGQANVSVTLDTPGGVQRGAARGTLSAVSAAGQRADRVQIDLSVTDPRVSADIRGVVEAQGVDIGGFSVSRARLTAQPEGGATRLTLDAAAGDGTLAAAGRLAMQGDSQTLRLDTLRLARAGVTATLTGPANVAYRSGRVSVDRLALALSGGGTFLAQGQIGETLDLTLDARAVPLALAALIDPAWAASGTLTASARVTGTPDAPRGRYDITVSRATTPQITSVGAGPFDLRASGTLDGARASLSASLSGPAVSGMTATGFIPISSGGALDLTVRGTVSLTLANAMLATYGARAAGSAAIDITLRGSFAEPRASGTVRVSGGRYEDAIHGVTLERIQAVITGTDRSLTVSSLQAFTPNGGSIKGQGTIALDPAGGFPGRIDLTLNNAGLVNSELIRFVAGGQLAVSGALVRAPTISGRIDVRALDVNIPDRLPGGATAIRVRHVNLPPGRRPATLRALEQRRKSTGAPFVATLDLTVSAPNRVFVRGMGMDAELAGTLHLRGTSAAPQTVGGFEMLRGRFDILGRRLDFTRGRLTFNGDTDPDLDFVAESTAGDVTARVLIAGRASQPEITFSSTPTLPQDEVVARLLFGRPAGQLTTGQALQVAQAVASMSGQGNALLGNLRRSLGVDSLSIGANAAGTGGELGIGQRLNDRISVGVRQGTTPGSSQATIDIDVTRAIRIQGATSANGATSVGVGAQWDY